MDNGIQRVSVKKGARCVHVETELGIVNIWVGLTDRLGRKVENIRMKPDNFSGEPRVKVIGSRFVQLKS